MSETTQEAAPQQAATEQRATTTPAPASGQGQSSEGQTSSGEARQERPRRRGGGRFGRRRVCAFCVDKVESIDYKEAAKLRRYVSDRGKIEPRRKTGTCAGHQRMLTIALKRARHIGLLPFTAQHIQLTGVFPTRS